MWTYGQRSGTLYDATDHYIAMGYSGYGLCKNDPAAQDRRHEGPIPRGLYTIEAPVDTKTHGPYVLWLVPDAENEMCGRSAFGLHGDSLVAPGHASEGCVILPRLVRQRIWHSDDHRLRVVA